MFENSHHLTIRFSQMEHQSHHIPFSSPLLLLALQLGIIAKAAAVAATAII